MQIPTEQPSFEELVHNDIEGVDCTQLLQHIRDSKSLDKLDIVDQYREEGCTTFETILTVDSVAFPLKFEYRGRSSASQIGRADEGNARSCSNILKEIKACLQ